MTARNHPFSLEPTAPGRSLFSKARYRAISLRGKSIINLAVLILAVLLVGVAGTLGLNNLNFQVDNLYNFMLIPIHEIEQANQTLSETPEAYTEIASGQLSRQDVQAAISQIQVFDGKFQATLNRYDSEWVTTQSEPFTQMLERNGRLVEPTNGGTRSAGPPARPTRWISGAARHHLAPYPRRDN
jgi:hypothetical protein